LTVEHVVVDGVHQIANLGPQRLAVLLAHLTRATGHAKVDEAVPLDTLARRERPRLDPIAEPGEAQWAGLASRCWPSRLNFSIVRCQAALTCASSSSRPPALPNTTSARATFASS